MQKDILKLQESVMQNGISTARWDLNGENLVLIRRLNYGDAGNVVGMVQQLIDANGSYIEDRF